MLGKLTGEDKPYSGLDLPRSDCWFLVIPSQSRSFLSELLKDVIDKTVHDPHGFARDPNVRVNLLQNLKYVDLVGFNAFLHPLLLLVAPSFFCYLLFYLRFLLYRYGRRW
ncbi:hypothetical protein AHAS_Ahas11G0129200 [Arachis hypogaea]